MTEPSFLSQSITRATRLNSDLTTYSGQFQSSRAYLSPWTGTQPAPAHSVTGKNFYLGAAIDQSFELNEVTNHLATFFWRPEKEVDIYLSTSLLSLDASWTSEKYGRLSLQAVGGMTLAESSQMALPDDGGQMALMVLPGSSLTYDITLGQVKVTLYDRVSARPDSVISRFPYGLMGLSQFSVIQNDLGAAFSVELSEKLTLSADFNRSTSRAMRDDVNELANREVQSLLASLTYEILPTWLAGLEGGWTETNYQTDFSPDGTQRFGGLFVEATLPWSHRLRLNGGVQDMQFKASSTLVLFANPFDPTPSGRALNTGDQSDLNPDPYYTLSLTGRLNPTLTHELSGGYEATLSPVSNFVQSHYANYSLHAGLWKGAAVSLGGFYEETRSSESFFAADTELLGGVAQIQQKIGRKFTVGVGYGYTQNNCHPHLDQHAAFRDPEVHQHAYSASVVYQICPKASLRLSWQRSEADVPSNRSLLSAARQNRYSLGMRVEF